MTAYFAANQVRFDLRMKAWESLDLGQIHAAVHEGAHAVVALASACRVTEVETFRPANASWRGHTLFRFPESLVGLELAVTDAAITAAPLAAADSMESSIRSAFDWGSRSTSDLDTLSALHSAHFAGIYTADEFERRMTRVAAATLEANGKVWTALVYALLQRGTLDEADVRAIAGELATRWKASAPPPPPVIRSQPQRSPLDVLHEVRARRSTFRSGDGPVLAGDAVADVSYR